MNLTTIVILSCWAILLLYWTVSAFFQKKIKEKTNIRGNLLHSLLLFISLVLLLISSKIIFLNYILIRVSLTINILSILFSIIGVVLCVYSRTVLGDNWSKDVIVKKNHELITKGPYRYMRHPIYSGMILLVLATALAIGNIGSTLGFIILLISLTLKSKQEEKLMIKTFGKKYIAYRKRTKALIPYVL